METLHNGYRLSVAPGCFPLSTDSMVLAHFVSLSGNARVLDLGSGCGTLGLLLCAKSSTCHITGLEQDATAHRCALDNIHTNGLAERMQSICADLRTHPLAPGSFDCCVSNPPYFHGGPPSRTLTDARREDQCSLSELFATATRALKFGGDLYLVHRPERLGELFHLACGQGLEPKQLGLLRHKATDAVSLVLVQYRKGARPGLRWSELCLYRSDGTPTELYRQIYHQ